MKNFKYTASLQDKNGIITAAFGASNNKLISNVVKKLNSKILLPICQDIDLLKMYCTTLNSSAYYIKTWNYETSRYDYIIKLSSAIYDINGTCYLIKELKRKKEYIQSMPDYYHKFIKFLSSEFFLELRDLDSELNRICIEIENLLQIKKAA